MKRNATTTNPKMNKQRAVPHQHWISSHAHILYQQAASAFGMDSYQAKRLRADGIVRYAGPPAPPTNRPSNVPLLPFGLPVDLLSVLNDKRQLRAVLA